MIFDPARFRRKAAIAAKWAALVAMAAVPRLAMMATVERRLDADESIVGLMAKHIAAGEGVPFFFYGQHYGGGHVIEALFAAPLFKAFGPSEWAIHLSPVLFSVGIVLLVYIYMQKVYGGKAGLLAAALTAFSTPFLKSSLKADGYVETIFLGMAALMVARLIEEAYRAGADRRRMMLCAALGVILGFAWWSYDFALIYAVALIPVALRFGMLSVPGAAVFAGGFAVGAIPLIAANLSSDFAHINQLLSGSGGVKAIVQAPNAFVTMLVSEIPSFFSVDCVHNFVRPAPWHSWLTYSALIMSVVILAGKRKSVPGAPVLVLAAAVVAYAATGFAGKSPRYLLPLEPVISMAVAAALVLLFRTKRHISFFTGCVIFALAASGIIVGAAAVFSDNSIVEGNVKTDPESLVHVVEFLDESGVDCVHTTYFIKWRILFLSDERINAVDIRANERETAYLRYEQAGCPPDEPGSYVFHNLSRHRYMLAAEINRVKAPYKVFYAEDHMAAIPALDEAFEESAR
ncbi:MAG: hypothetical protein BWY28_00109 [bacterium ADurb.Bin236]|nr:MAG: hypothetical protein BWY28_00109 [bacterium ADurb.Bin236]HPN95228.1 glycosyltransferase family 39 protein [bacterium]